MHTLEKSQMLALIHKTGGSDFIEKCFLTFFNQVPQIPLKR